MILDELKSATQRRVAREKEEMPLEEIKSRLLDSSLRRSFGFEKAISGQGMHYICEIKKASPSKGIIAGDFPYKEIAAEYEKAGASCISCLTEPDYFKGRLSYLKEIRDIVSIPILRKDFTCDEYMIYQAALNGADAVLLIAAILTDGELVRFMGCAESLGISCLFEAHDEAEVKRCLNAGAKIVGVNNRDLKDFTVDISNSIRLRSFVPENVLFVAESGIKTADDVAALKKNGVNACLIGETLMKAADKEAVLHELEGTQLIKKTGKKD